MILGKVSTSDRRIETDLAQAQNFSIERLSSKLAILSFSGQRIQYYLPKRNRQLPVGECNSGWVNFNFRPENLALPSRNSVHSSRQTQLKAVRNYHPPARRASISWLGEISNFPVREYAIVLQRDWFSGEGIEFQQAEYWNFLFERVSASC